ncbi:hydantoinase/oxoprolinase family protein [Candidatus Eisenbacteria bacterium]|uniref:Hydantoinase/oxoprolinase family protein n=1 Tax=Eiseniibacteriota bacterium TaxID=2212470 RepID=A0ABV6YI87_UNCEI
MSLRIGIDVGGTFTDFLVTREGDEPRIFKVLSTPSDPSIGLLAGMKEIADSMGLSLKELGASVETIVHGTTVTTNAVLTHTGAKTGLLTTEGVRDALEMRRGIREEQYNNRYTNVPPLVPRYLRQPVQGRLDYSGKAVRPLNLDDVRRALDLFRAEKTEAVAICFMNSFANPEHEEQAAELVRRELPGAYLTSSSELLPSIRFYDRVSTTVLNSYVGPKLSHYLVNLKLRLKEIGFAGVLLIMQSNGGVMSPEVANRNAALTLLSGPAAGPRAGLGYAQIHGRNSCITVDMGGTSFDAALVRDGTPIVVTEGEINRYRIALPMLGIVTIGAGGGSIGWIDQGGLLRMGPQSAGADPGPACYGKGGTFPACTDADLTLGYLDPEFFAGGKMKLDKEAAERAITEKIAQPLGLPTLEAAAGMYRVINTNMAQGVREITIKRGYDPREFLMVVAGGAGPLHACMICQELEIPMFIVPRESSIFCAAGMLMSNLQHDFVRSAVSILDRIDSKALRTLVEEMITEGTELLTQESIAEDNRRFQLAFDCRYVKQYHEVSVPVSVDAINAMALAEIRSAFHAEHNRLYGYSLESEGTPIELINVRLRALGITEKPAYRAEDYAGEDPQSALKGERRIYVPDLGELRTAPVYDGHLTRCGNRIAGPAVIEQVNTTLLVSSAFDCVSDRYGSFAVYLKGRDDLASEALRETQEEVNTLEASGETAQ